MATTRGVARRGGAQQSAEEMTAGLKKAFESNVVVPADADSASGVAQVSVDEIAALNKTQFEQLLRRFKIPVEEYGKGKAKHISDLWVELALGETKLEVSNGELWRSARVMVVELHATIDGRDLFLMLKDMLTESGADRKSLNTRVTRKMFVDEHWESAAWRCVSQNLNLSEKICRDSFVIEWSKDLREEKDSLGFPGLTTYYTLHICRMKMTTTCLPTSEQFETNVDGAMNSGSKRVWMWCSRAFFESLYPDSKQPPSVSWVQWLLGSGVCLCCSPGAGEQRVRYV